MKSRWIGIISIFTFCIAVLGNGCQSPSDTATSESNQTLAKLEDLSNPNNGRTYDGKIVRYHSRNQVTCGTNPEPEIEIENNKLLETFRVIRLERQNDGLCKKSELTDQVDVEAFEDSHLAAFEGKLHDKILNFGDLDLDNLRTKIVCKLKHGEMLLLDNQWTGAVIMETDQTLIWNSRLDFAQRSPGTGFIFDDPPPGALVQTPTTLEFRTRPDAILRRKGVYQSLHIKIDRPASDLASPSLGYGKRIYPGQIQYFFADYTQEPVSGVSTAPMDGTCFVDQIDPSRVQVVTSGSYDFIQAILKAFQSGI
jgi:hypothetical protein